MTNSIIEPFWQSFINLLPQILGAILVFIIGWFVSKWIGELTEGFLKRTKLNQAAKRLGWDEALSKIDVRLNLPKVFGIIVRVFFVILFLVACFEMIGLSQFSQDLWKAVVYYMNIFVACIIFIVAIFLADFSQKIVIGSLEKNKITYSRFVGKGMSWAIWALATLAILYQLQIVPTLILTIFIGVTALIVLSLGIAFGLGGKDLAAKILKELEDKWK